MNLPFHLSTQAKRWSFSRETLYKCREHCLSLGPDGADAKPRNFASGFHNRYRKSEGALLSNLSSTGQQVESKNEPSSAISLDEKESLLRFHSNQIAKLVGPSVVCPDMKKSYKSVATAISLFRRYYLSNDILDVHHPPHQMKAAAVYLATKIEDEPLKAPRLAAATAHIHERAKKNSLYGNELQGVTVEAIEEGERRLLQGINFDMICFHPLDTINALSSEISEYLSDFYRMGYVAHYAHAISRDIQARAHALCYRALVGTDAPFLYAPGRIAYAVTTIAFQSIRCEGLSGYEMENFLRFRFPSTPLDELKAFEQDIEEIVLFLTESPQMELTGCGPSHTWNEAEELWQILTKVAKIRNGNRMACGGKKRLSQATKRSHKRARMETEQSQKMSKWARRMCPEVTPISQN